MPLTLEDVVLMDGDQLDRLMREGHRIDEGALEEREFDGVSLNLPTLIEKLTWTKFCKVFHREHGGALRGWNCKVEQTPLDSPWILTQKDDRPVTYGHYRVVSPEGYRMPRPYDRGLLLDYGKGGNPRRDPTARVRDPIVAVNPGSSALLLGWSYLDLGLTTLSTPSFFVLRRGAELSHVVAPPRLTTA